VPSDPLSYLWTEKALNESEAFRGLTKTAILVLHDFHAKKRVRGSGKRWQVLNNGELVYSYAEAGSRGISRSAFMNAIDQLIERGFLYVAEQGGGLKGHASKYGLSTDWTSYGTPSFSAKTRKKRRPQYPGAGFQSGHPYHGRTDQKS
jgi:hypothetical protein